MILFLLPIFLALQIVLFVKAVKTKRNVYWIFLFVIEVISAAVTEGIARYYDSLPGYSAFMPGLDYLGEVLLCIGAIALYCLMFLISVIVKIVSEERKRKQNPVFLLLACGFLICGAGFLVHEVVKKWDDSLYRTDNKLFYLTAFCLAGVFFVIRYTKEKKL